MTSDEGLPIGRAYLVNSGGSLTWRLRCYAGFARWISRVAVARGRQGELPVVLAGSERKAGSVTLFELAQLASLEHPSTHSSGHPNSDLADRMLGVGGTREIGETPVQESIRSCSLGGGLKSSRIWFHAASVGELESLWPVIRGWLDESGHEAVVSVFSRSAAGALRRLAEECERLPGRLLMFGFSPVEGEWWQALGYWRPGLFLTVKYEAWPELWSALTVQGIPLWLVGAKDRPALRIAKQVVKWLVGREPRLTFLTVRPSDAEELGRRFRDARLEAVGEPRWDRVFDRASRGNSRARSLLERLAHLPRPWAVFGSVWPEDLEAWRSKLREIRGTVWLVPHDLSFENLEAIEAQVRNEGFRVLRSSGLDRNGSEGASGVLPISQDDLRVGALGATTRPEQSPRKSARNTHKKADEKTDGAEGKRSNPTIPDVELRDLALPSSALSSSALSNPTPPNCVLVDEMGFLLELYTGADWAFVGGGFGKGVHSTLEPAIRGIPLACGPARAERFPEILELQATGQLRVVRDRRDLERWLKDLQAMSPARIEERRSLWRDQAEARRGAAMRIVAKLKDWARQASKEVSK